MIIKRKLYSKIKGLPKAVRNTRYIVGGKTPTAARKAVKLGRDTERVIEGSKKRVINTAVETMGKANKVKSYLSTTAPDRIAGDAVGKLVKAPVATIGTTAGYVVPAVGGPFVPGTTAASAAADAFIRNKVPGYGKATNWAGKQYEKHLRKPVEGMARVVTNMPW